MAEGSAIVSRPANANNGPAEFLQIEECLEDIITDENSTAVFECKVDGIPQPICAWYKDGIPIISSQRTKITSNVNKWHRLEIKNVNAADHGIYSVVCRNNYKHLTSKAYLFVAFKNISDGVFHTLPNTMRLAVAKHLRNVKVNKGDRIELEASFEPDVMDDENYFWFNNNKLIKENERTIILKSKRSTVLTVLNSELTDSGVYHIVTKTKQGIASSFADVLVTDTKESTNNDERSPTINELFIEDLEINENDGLRLICKVTCDINTDIEWHNNGTALNKSNFLAKDYGNSYIGLKGKDVTLSDNGEYSVILRNEKTGGTEKTNSFLTVSKPPMESPSIPLKRPLESVVACYGSKVTFDCSFGLNNPKYFYVVWYVGRFKVERTNTRFAVMYSGGEFVLFIKKLEPGMTGEVVCELRRSVPNKKSVHVNYTVASLNVVPACFMPDAKAAGYPVMNPKIHDAKSPCVDSVKLIREMDADVDLGDKTAASNGNGHRSGSKVVLEIVYCRLNDDGLFYLHGSTSHSEVITNLTGKHKPNKYNTVIISWIDASAPMNWYAIEMVQHDGSYLEVAFTSKPSFELKEVLLYGMVTFRIKTVPRASSSSDIVVSIKPTYPPSLLPKKVHKLQEMEAFVRNYTKNGELIGNGAFGSVVVVLNSSGEKFAAKIMKTSTQKRRNSALREFNVMRQLRHPRIVEMIDAYSGKQQFIIVTDYLWGGELFDRIVDEENFKEVDVVPYVRQILEALEYLHSFNCAHLDLKPENIVCLHPNSGQVKLIDFGIARVLKEGQMTRAIYGTRDYVAPEVLNYEMLSLACDMWSMGVVTFMLLSGVLPFAGDTWIERSTNITLANYNYDDSAFREISSLARDFVDRLLVLKPGSRMSASTALRHKWIQEGPPRGAKAGHMKRTRDNLRSYLAIYRERWQRAGNVMIAAHRLRMRAGSTRADAEEETAPCVT